MFKAIRGTGMGLNLWTLVCQEHCSAVLISIWRLQIEVMSSGWNFSSEQVKRRPYTAGTLRARKNMTGFDPLPILVQMCSSLFESWTIRTVLKAQKGSGFTAQEHRWTSSAAKLIWGASRTESGNWQHHLQRWNCANGFVLRAECPTTSPARRKQILSLNFKARLNSSQQI